MATELRKLVVGGGAVALATRLFSIGISSVTAFLLARVLGPAEFGSYSFLISIATVAAVLIQFGAPNIAAKVAARSAMTGHWRAVNRISSYSQRVLAAIAVGLALASALVLVVIKAPATQYVSTLSVLAIIVSLSLVTIHGAILRGAGHHLSGLMPELVARPVMFLLLLCIILAVQFRVLDSTLALLAYSAASVASLALCLHQYYRITHDRFSWARPLAGGIGRSLFVSAPFAVVEVTNIFNQQATALIGGFVTAESEVGIIRVAVQFGMLVSVGFTALNLFVAPRIALLAVSGERQKLQDLATAAANVSTGLSLTILVILVAFGRQIITALVGHEYQAAYGPLLIISAGQVVNSATASVGALLMMTGNERTLSFILVTVAATSVPLYAIFIGLHGAVGAAGVSAAVTVAWNSWLVMAAYKATGVWSLAGPPRSVAGATRP